MYDTLFSLGCQCPLTLAGLLPGLFLICRPAGNGDCSGGTLPGDDSRVDVAEPGLGGQDGPLLDVCLQLLFRNPQVFVLFPCSDVYMRDRPDNPLGGPDVDTEAVGHVCGGQELCRHRVLPFIILEIRKENSFHQISSREGCFSGLPVYGQLETGITVEWHKKTQADKVCVFCQFSILRFFSQFYGSL